MSKLSFRFRFLNTIIAAAMLLLLLSAIAQWSAATSPAAASPGNSWGITSAQRIEDTSWVRATDLQPPIYHYAFATDTLSNTQRFYVIGGSLGGTHGGTNAVQRYDTSNSSWTTLSPVPAADNTIVSAGAVYTGGKIYVAGGRNQQVRCIGPDCYFKTLYIYNTLSNTWITTGTGMLSATIGSAVGAYGDNVYVAGGYSDSLLTRSILQKYIISRNTWILGPTPPHPIAFSGYTQVGQYLYVVGGYGSGGGNITATMRLDMTTEVWDPNPGPSFPTPGRADFALASDGRYLYAIGGNTYPEGGFNPTDEVDRYLLSSWPNGSWTVMPTNYNLPTPRMFNSAGFYSEFLRTIWSVGGADAQQNALNDNLYLPVSLVASSPTPVPTSTPPPPTITPGGPTATPGPPTSTPGPPTSTPGPPAPSPTTCDPGYTDARDNWAYAYILSLSCRGIVSGYPDHTFRPNAQVTRAELTKMVWLGFGLAAYTPTGNPDFTDVPSSYWAYVYIESGFHNGILSGFDATTCAAQGAIYPCFLPNQPVSRAEMVKILVNASHRPLYTPSTRTYNDVPPSHWAYTPIETATYYQWVNGYPNRLFLPNFLPNAASTRAEMSRVLYLAIAPHSRPGK